MNKDYLKLHIAVLLAGFTGIIGKLVSVNEFVLVWYRMGMAALILWAGLLITRKIAHPTKIEVLKLSAIGALIALHWVFFFGSIIRSNISIGVICYSMVGFFSAILEPLLLHKKFSVINLLLSAISIGGIMLIFSFDGQYRSGILMGLASAAVCALFTILQKKWGNMVSPYNMMCYEMSAGCAVLTLFIPFYLHTQGADLSLSLPDSLYILLLASVCTILPLVFQIQILRRISPFTVNLSYNLEPVYSIILAFLFFGESKSVNFSFYVGLALIILSVLLQSLRKQR